MRLLPRALPALALPLVLFSSAEPPRAPFAEPRAAAALRLVATACGSPALERLAGEQGASACPVPAPTRAQPASGAARTFAAPAATSGDGTLITRQRLVTVGPVALDLVAYLSSNLVVGGLLCFVDDGLPRPTVLHLHGGFGGIFVNPDGGDTIGACYRWAAENGKNAFVPSYRGQDGGQGQPELCLGEADDVASAALLLRSLPIVDPNRLAVVGGSMGGCVALRAGTRIPDLRAVVAIAPMTDFEALTTHHRTAFTPALETRCDGSTLEWNTGGPAFADLIDASICGHPGCTEAEYASRSPIPDLLNASNPTLVLAAGADNIVPVGQQVLWSALRASLGEPVDVEIRDRCSSVAAPPLGDDVLVYVPGAYHLMEDGPVISTLVYLTELLDAAEPAPAAGL